MKPSAIYKILVLVLSFICSNFSYAQDFGALLEEAKKVLETPTESNKSNTEDGTSIQYRENDHNNNNNVEDTGAANGVTGKRISPFGPIEWDDSLYDVLQNISEYQGIKKVRLTGVVTKDISYGAIQTQKSTTGFIDATNPPEQRIISDMLSKGVIANQNGNTENNTVSTHTAGLTISSYISPDKEPVRYVQPASGASLVRVEAGPINIANTLYIIIIEFDNEPGLALKRPENVLYSNKFDIYWPLVIEEITLQPLYNLSEEEGKRVWNAISKKYANFKNPTYYDHNRSDSEFRLGLRRRDVAGAGTTVEDDYGSRVLVKLAGLRQTGNNFLIMYQNFNIHNRLENLYKEHKDNYDMKGVKDTGIKDSSSDL